MANVSLVLPFDNYAQEGSQSEEQLIQAIANANGGQRPGVSERVLDPSTGKLIQNRLTFPDTASAAAIDAVNENPGIVSTCLNLVIPARGANASLSPAAPDGIVWSAGNPITGQIFNLRHDNGLQLGALKDTGYIHQSNVLAVTTRMVLNNSSAVDFILTAAQTLTLNFSDGGSLILVNTADIVVVPGDSKVYYHDEDGNMYLARGDGESLTYDFSASCLGPV